MEGAVSVVVYCLRGGGCCKWRMLYMLWSTVFSLYFLVSRYNIYFLFLNEIILSCICSTPILDWPTF